jgi:hypothetical protein
VPLERPGRWGRWIRGLLTAAVCTMVGTLLVLLPWVPGWDQNYFSGSRPEWYAVWMNSYFRGAVSGVGVLNLYISFLELLGLVRGTGS